jgi:cytochrome oxidase assembly protein ShyY1
MVNRGWIPQSHVDRFKRKQLNKNLALPEGTVTIMGMVRREKYYRPRTAPILPEPFTAPTTDCPAARWIWLDLPSMISWIKYRLHVDQNVHIPDLANRFFIEEVLDLDALQSNDNEDRDIIQNMLSWYEEDLDREEIAASLPSVLAAVKMSHTDARMFHGKPIVVPPSINVPNNHLGYVYTWFSLAGFLMLMIRYGNRSRYRINKSGFR